MANFIDITGTIQEGMWHYPPPFPRVAITPMPKVPWVDGDVFCEIFEGLHSQTGTYLETPAHFYGNDKSYLLIDVDIATLINHDCVVLNLGSKTPPPGKARYGITVEDLESCPAAKEIREGDDILVGTNWGGRWMEPDYLESGPYLTYDAMQWLIAKKPYILGSDTSRWENLEEPQGFFPDFYAANILMLAPCINLEMVTKPRVKLTVLPLKIPRTSCAPCRAVILEE
ncbi:MAG: cyclase family protein [Clostridia bacterium]|nr:cyclase family protein [Clostridia bacterium]